MQNRTAMHLQPKIPKERKIGEKSQSNLILEQNTEKLKNI